jgi:hypothetical protein
VLRLPSRVCKPLPPIELALEMIRGKALHIE